MQIADLFSLREHFNHKKILLCFNGPFSKGLLEEIGIALKNHTQKDNPPSLAMDIFSVYIELTQNIRHYSVGKGYSDMDSSATVVIAKDNEERFLIFAGNLVEPSDADRLSTKITELANMDKLALKAAYKKQLRQPRDIETNSGAGLGLLEIARKTSKPLSSSLSPVEDGRVFFSLLATV